MVRRSPRPDRADGRPVRRAIPRRRYDDRHPNPNWALVDDGNVYVRAARGPKSSWYQAAMSQGAGRIRVAGQYFDVTFEGSGDTYEQAIDHAYEAKCPG